MPLGHQELSEAQPVATRDNGHELRDLAEEVMGDKAREVGDEDQAAELYDVPFAADLHEHDQPKADGVGSPNSDG